MAPSVSTRVWQGCLAWVMWSRAILGSKAQWPFSGTDIRAMDFRTILLAEPDGQLESAVSIFLLAERLEPSMVKQTKTAERMQFRSWEELPVVYHSILIIRHNRLSFRVCICLFLFFIFSPSLFFFFFLKKRLLFTPRLLLQYMLLLGKGEYKCQRPYGEGDSFMSIFHT